MCYAMSYMYMSGRGRCDKENGKLIGDKERGEQSFYTAIYGVSLLQRFGHRMRRGGDAYAELLHFHL